MPRPAPWCANVLAELERKLSDRTRTAVDGALAPRQPHPPAAPRRHRLAAAPCTPTCGTTNPSTARSIPERIVGYGRRRQSLAKDVIVAVDQSGSMADSVVYASLFGSVLAQLPSLRTRLVVFDTSVTDLTPVLHDPVDVLFGVQLGGGTDIAQAVGYCRQFVTRPADTVLILISRPVRGRQSRPAAGDGCSSSPVPASRCSACWRSATRARPFTTD